MGACQSSSAVPVLDTESLKRRAGEEPNDVPTRKLSSMNSSSRRLSTDVTNDDENNCTEEDVGPVLTKHEKDVQAVSPTAKDEDARGGGGGGAETDDAVRETNDAVGLNEMKNSIKADGPLNETVVRMETPIGIPIEEVYDGVHDGQVLGSGVEGVVRLVRHKATGVEYASKSIDIGLVRDAESLAKLRNEISIMCQVDHPNIVRLEEVYESESEIYLVQELCLGGDLFDRLDAMPDYHYTENQCARLIKQMLSALLYLHSKNIIHRDLKLENFLFSSSAPDDSLLKLVDFGLSKHFQFGEVQHESVGTPYTVSPEVIKGSYDERSDLWAIGVITYLLLSGETPFGGCDGEDVTQVRDNILRGFVAFEPDEYWENTSELAKEFIRKLLVADYRDRPSAKESLRHSWIEGVTGHDASANNKDDSVHGSGVNPDVVRALVSFKEYSVMRKLLLEILSFTLLPEQIIGLRSDFEKIDMDGDGEISFEELKGTLVRNAEAGSLGSLTEREVEQIFDAMRVRKSEKTVRWHEFIAACLSQCQVDERNLRLAFNRLDADRKGYITFDNIMDVIGSNGNREELQVLWRESIRNECSSEVERIRYDDFVLLMKGQTQDGFAKTQTTAVPSFGASVQPLIRGSRNDTVDGECAAEANKRLTRNGTSAPRARSMVHMSSSPLVSSSEDDDERGIHPVRTNSLRLLLLPGRRESIRLVDRVIRDETKSTLVIGKTVYRANREMRLAVLEAVKRFEEKQAAKQRECCKGAGLIMQRGGSNARTEEEILATAIKRSGRAHHRYRSASDLTGLLLMPPKS